MSYEIVVDETSEYPLATNRGWRELERWAAGEGGPLLKEFTANNETSNVQGLKKELVHTLKTKKSIPEDIRTTIEHLATVALRLGKKAYVTDGVS